MLNFSFLKPLSQTFNLRWNYCGINLIVMSREKWNLSIENNCENIYKNAGISDISGNFKKLSSFIMIFNFRAILEHKITVIKYNL